MNNKAATLDRPPPVSLTEAAARRMKAILDAATEPAEGIRITVSDGGCSGKTYKMDYARGDSGSCEVIEHHGVRVWIDPGAILYLIGTEIDYEEKLLESGFVFRNPNETARCGCGESFSI